MSIKFAIRHIHDELAKLQALSHTYPEDVFEYAIRSIKEELSDLWNHANNVTQSPPTPVPGPSPAVDAPERPHAVEETPSTTDNVSE